MKTDWNTYRTRFLVRARQLTEAIRFVDVLGREHRGQAGDYLVEFSDGTRRVTSRQLFEDIYVAMNPPPASALHPGDTFRSSPQPPVAAPAGANEYARRLSAG